MKQNTVSEGNTTQPSPKKIIDIKAGVALIPFVDVAGFLYHN